MQALALRFRSVQQMPPKIQGEKIQPGRVSQGLAVSSGTEKWWRKATFGAHLAPGGVFLNA